MEGGNALAKLLSGEANFSGHLPFTMAKDENDYPDFLFPSAKTRDITYGAYHGYTLLEKENKTAAFPFGFGLSYTEFEYSDIKAADCGDTVEISLTIKNTGACDGKTVVQIYAAGSESPVKLLKGFKKIFVKAGESVGEKITVNKNDLRYYNPDTKEWELDKNYTFFVGQNCEETEAVTV